MFLSLLLSLSCMAKDINVFVIDTGVDKSVSTISKYISKDSDEDTHDHGTAIVSLILYGNLKKKDTVCDNVKITVCNYYKDPARGLEEEINCLKKIKKNEYDFINFSGGGYEPSLEEAQELNRILDKSKTRFIAAAGNEGVDIYTKRFYPAILKLLNFPIDIIGNGISLKDKARTSNYMSKNIIWVDGRDVSVYIRGGEIKTMNGTSMSAALYTHKLIKEKCK